ncbi:ribonuclease activity regulator RraA [Halioglobus maricola]|uniref:Ribonuclease activity regulator RraA n=1 Tax=Halioglobus maricola TaxID=2601894 RepID=A0A5P9NKE9_9GAMM|nr:ribonuclease activity regulator RraA [Halioglobus maricola]QFU76320.1 ribonuclease activity regulator RraA [Halioglobus maricola]
MNSDTHAILKATSTASIATMLYKRGLRGQYIQGVARLNPAAQRMVGPVYTLRYIPAREDLNPITVFQDTNHPQRRAVEEIPSGHVLVMDCRQDASAASAGSILATRLEIRGCAGIVTDGGLRDAEEIAQLDMPSFCTKPSAPTNLTKHQAMDLDVPIGCGGVAVFPGDIAVGDGDGVIIIPAHLADEIAQEAKGMEKYEAWVIEQVKSGRPIIGLYPMNEDTRAEFEAYLDE